MGFFDDPEHLPKSHSGWPRHPGETVEGTVTRLALLAGRYRNGELTLCVELDGDGRQRWCNNRLWRALGDARVDLGDRIRVTRGADEPSQNGERPASTWTVERLNQTAPATVVWGAPSAAVKPSGPTW